MALFVLGDTHLSLGGSKPMDVFPGWNGYVERLPSSIICAFGLASAAPRSPYRHLELCGIALKFLGISSVLSPTCKHLRDMLYCFCNEARPVFWPRLFNYQAKTAARSPVFYKVYLKAKK